MNEIRFGKEELLEELKNDILDRLSDDFYEWIFIAIRPLDCLL